MEQTYSLDTDNRLAGQEILLSLLNPKISLPYSPGQAIGLYPEPHTYLYKIHFNIILCMD
jgi:hypothetical protein